MPIAHSKVTAQGQISVPAAVRRKLGIGPGSVIEWDEEGENVIVRRAGCYSSEDVHRAVFPEGPPKPRTVDEMKQGARRHIRDDAGQAAVAEEFIAGGAWVSTLALAEITRTS